MKTNELFAKAKEVRSRAHAPYSKFQVGAALVDDKGNAFTGCNVENASYGATVCAERNAIASMVAGGGKSFSEIVVVTDTPDGCPPCGMCRQVLAEFAGDLKAARIHVANLKGVVKVFSVADLLPEAFGRDFLEND